MNREAVARLRAAGVPSPEFDVRALEEVATDTAHFEAMLVRRERRVPLQHITGRAYFRHLELSVGPGVFIPRPETELLAQVGIDELERLIRTGRTGLQAVELCAGSGAIALALATEAVGTRVTAVELSNEAMPYLQANVAAYSLAHVSVIHADATASELLTELNGTVDVVLSNPPYIPVGMIPREPEVRDHDPHLALFGGDDGFDVARGVVAVAQRLLKPGGLFGMEHADVQGQSVVELFADGWTDVVDHRDYNDLPRFVTARKIGA